MTVILGINAYHGDSSACLVVGGALAAAAEEERFRRIKHWAGFPAESIRYCLRAGRVRLQDVTHVAVNSDPRANFLKKLRFVVQKRPELKAVLGRVRNAKKRVELADEFGRAFPGERFSAEVRRVEHHLSHLASAYYVSPFDEACVLSVDGFGDFSSSAWGVGKAGVIDIDDRVLFPHSLGTFYQALTQFLGFPNYGDEYKLMGLAPYGKPTFLPKLREIVALKPNGHFELNLDYFRHHVEDVAYSWEGGVPSVSRLFSPALAELLGPARTRDEPLTDEHRDMAHSVQAMYEEAFFHQLEHLHRTYGHDALALAGGCAMNSVANGKVRRRSSFKRLYVQSAAGDAGGAIGAALQVRASLGERSKVPMTHAYWGPEYSQTQLDAALSAEQTALDDAGCQTMSYDDETQLSREVASDIGEGKVIGWFQGRMEWGPRALGNRSILGDPRRADMKDILNLKIKRRESFRPFAPSILREHVPDWFEEDDDVPFMMKVFQVREERRAQVAAITHVDGSGRLQTVTADTNPRYAALITAFHAQTGVPLLLNTSFNENEPVVCRPEEAIACFLRTKMDVLVLGTTVCRRTS